VNGLGDAVEFQGSSAALARALCGEIVAEHGKGGREAAEECKHDNVVGDKTNDDVVAHSGTSDSTVERILVPGNLEA
jgi:hypothetical protein